MIRLTVLGSAESGKTSLISTWVNNFCPAFYTPTEDPALFYRTVRIPPRDGEGTEPISVLVELEDVYAWERTDGLTCHGFQRDAPRLIRETKGGEKSSHRKPLSDQMSPSCKKHAPLMKRSGYFVVFDISNSSSLDIAKDICNKVEDKLYVCLIANKVDKLHEVPDGSRTIEDARDFANKKKIHFLAVSALEYTRVRKLFRDAVEALSESSDAVQQQQGQTTNAPAQEEATTWGPNLGANLGVNLGGLFGW